MTVDLVALIADVHRANGMEYGDRGGFVRCRCGWVSEELYPAPEPGSYTYRRVHATHVATCIIQAVK